MKDDVKLNKPRDKSARYKPPVPTGGTNKEADRHGLTPRQSETTGTPSGNHPLTRSTIHTRKAAIDVYANKNRPLRRNLCNIRLDDDLSAKKPPIKPERRKLVPRVAEASPRKSRHHDCLIPKELLPPLQRTVPPFRSSHPRADGRKHVNASPRRSGGDQRSSVTTSTRDNGPLSGRLISGCNKLPGIAPDNKVENSTSDISTGSNKMGSDVNRENVELMPTSTKITMVTKRNILSAKSMVSLTASTDTFAQHASRSQSARVPKSSVAAATSSDTQIAKKDTESSELGAKAETIRYSPKNPKTSVDCRGRSGADACISSVIGDKSPYATLEELANNNVAMLSGSARRPVGVNFFEILSSVDPVIAQSTSDQTRASDGDTRQEKQIPGNVAKEADIEQQSTGQIPLPTVETEMSQNECVTVDLSQGGFITGLSEDPNVVALKKEPEKELEPPSHIGDELVDSLEISTSDTIVRSGNDELEQKTVTTNADYAREMSLDKGPNANPKSAYDIPREEDSLDDDNDDRDETISPKCPDRQMDEVIGSIPSPVRGPSVDTGEALVVPNDLVQAKEKPKSLQTFNGATEACFTPSAATKSNNFSIEKDSLDNDELSNVNLKSASVISCEEDSLDVDNEDRDEATPQKCTDHQIDKGLLVNTHVINDDNVPVVSSEVIDAKEELESPRTYDGTAETDCSSPNAAPKGESSLREKYSTVFVTEEKSVVGYSSRKPVSPCGSVGDTNNDTDFKQSTSNTRLVQSDGNVEIATKLPYELTVRENKETEHFDNAVGLTESDPVSDEGVGRQSDVCDIKDSLDFEFVGEDPNPVVGDDTVLVEQRCPHNLLDLTSNIANETVVNNFTVGDPKKAFETESVVNDWEPGDASVERKDHEKDTTIHGFKVQSLPEDYIVDSPKLYNLVESTVNSPEDEEGIEKTLREPGNFQLAASPYMTGSSDSSSTASSASSSLDNSNDATMLNRTIYALLHCKDILINKTRPNVKKSKNLDPGNSIDIGDTLPEELFEEAETVETNRRSSLQEEGVSLTESTGNAQPKSDSRGSASSVNKNMPMSKETDISSDFNIEGPDDVDGGEFREGNGHFLPEKDAPTRLSAIAEELPMRASVDPGVTTHSSNASGAGHGPQWNCLAERLIRHGSPYCEYLDRFNRGDEEGLDKSEISVRSLSAEAFDRAYENICQTRAIGGLIHRKAEAIMGRLFANMDHAARLGQMTDQLYISLLNSEEARVLERETEEFAVGLSQIFMTLHRIWEAEEAYLNSCEDVVDTIADGEERQTPSAGNNDDNVV